MTNSVLLDTPMQLGDVSLAPVTDADKDGLRAAANSEETWKWYTYRADGDYFDTQFWDGFHHVRNPEKQIHFAVRQNDKIVGLSCFLCIEPKYKTLEIGSTWYHADVRGGIVNPSCKLMLLERAFKWGAQRVELKTDSNNARSRAAILKLGCQFEGILRNHKYLHDGRVRHSAYFSMIPEEWPAAKAKLEARIAALA